MSSSISIVRRLPNVIDATIGVRPGIIGFRFSAAANFDLPFVAFQTVPNVGCKSPSVPDLGAIGSQFKDQVRFLFNPNDYTATVPAVRDDKQFFIRIEAQNPDGTFQPPETIHTVMPVYPSPHRPIILHGNAPTGSVLTHSIEVELPQVCNDFEIRNGSTGTNLFVAFERPTSSPTGPEFLIKPGESLTRIYTNIAKVCMRGDGGVVEVYSIYTLKDSPSNL